MANKSEGKKDEDCDSIVETMHTFLNDLKILDDHPNYLIYCYMKIENDALDLCLLIMLSENEKLSEIVIINLKQWKMS